MEQVCNRSLWCKCFPFSVIVSLLCIWNCLYKKRRNGNTVAYIAVIWVLLNLVVILERIQKYCYWSLSSAVLVFLEWNAFLLCWLFNSIGKKIGICITGLYVLMELFLFWNHKSFVDELEWKKRWLLKLFHIEIFKGNRFSSFYCLGFWWKWHSGSLRVIELELNSSISNISMVVPFLYRKWAITFWYPGK